jgi:hypothetical protein
VLVRDLCLFPVYRFRPDYYVSVYWYSQCFSVLIGCGVVWEVYKLALVKYPGAAQMARKVLAFIFILSMSRIVANALNDPKWLPARTAYEAERDLRIVQITVLMGLVALLAYYAVPIGRNLKGILGGYGTFLAVSVIHLSLAGSLGRSFPNYWEYAQRAAYIVVLLVWSRALWRYAPALSDQDIRLETDYQAMLTATRKRLGSALTYVGRAARP